MPNTQAGSIISPRVLANNFTVTNSTTLVNITNMTLDVIAGLTYRFRFRGTTLLVSAAGEKWDVGGTCTATAINYSIVSISNTGTVPIQVISTSLNTSGANTGYTGSIVVIEGAITVNLGGTLTIRFAQSVANASPCQVNNDASFEIIQTE